ncbi:hypothetical protein AVEN_219953-1 [Araneus ventricosus]|uniref:Uncharacterized protein n=1 Tax=Araneus ventricosus TaxID=182803 RepID=A0A4Y2NCY3_ARAVE|nr:hypothetical protein AVEN_219953-1 [Araneus ventricosus]
MLHAAFQNIKCLPHFGVRWRVFFNTFVPVGINQLLFLGLAYKQLGKFPSLLVWQLLECPRQRTPTLHTLPSAYLQEVQWKLPTVTSMPAKWTTFKERSRKIYSEILGICVGKVVPDVCLQAEREILRTPIVNPG